MSRSSRSLMLGTVAAMLAVTALTAQTTAAGTTADPARLQPAPQPMRKLPNANDFVLTWDNRVGDDSYADLIRELRDDLDIGPLEYTNPAEFLAAATKRATRNCPQAMQDTGALRSGSARVVTQNWFCLEKADATVERNLNEPRWVTQGISGTWDSHTQGTVNGTGAFALSWHYVTGADKNNASRITLLGEGAPYRYDHALLVEPRTVGNDVTYQNLRIHAGGLVWYKQYLLVTDDHSGIYVFDMHDLLDMRGRPNTNITSKNLIGLRNDTYYTAGYRYILPLIGVWRPRSGQGGRCHAESVPPCYTYAGLDRSTSPPTVLTGEWCPAGSTGCTVGRVARWRMRPENTFCVRGCLEFSGNSARATEAYTQVADSTQGGISWKGVYQFTRSNNPTSLGRRYQAIPDRTPVPHFAGKGVQDLYWQRSPTTREPVLLWSVTEYPGRGDNTGMRVLYGVTP